MNQSIHLFRLQKTDTQIDQINNRLSEIKHIIDTDQTILLAEKEISRTKIDVDLSQEILNKLDGEVNSLRIKLEICDSSLYGGKIKSPKELKDLQDEIASINRHISNLEEKQLEAMFVLEQYETLHKNNLEELQKVKGVFFDLKAALDGESSQANKTKDHLLYEREIVIKSISEENLDQYNQKRLQKRGIAVTTTHDGACVCCGSSLRPAELQSAKTSLQLSCCSSCGRILYVGT